MTTDTTKKTYKDTLNLPQTGFPMEAKLVQNEPARLEQVAGGAAVREAARRPGRLARSGSCTTARPSPTATSTSGT